MRDSNFLNLFSIIFLSSLCSASLNSQKPDVYRLPNQVVPVSYVLKIAPNLDDFTFVGEVNIKVHVKFTTNRIILHSKHLEIKNVTVRKLNDQAVGNNQFINTTKYELVEETDILIIENDRYFEYDTDYKVSILFHGVMHDPYGDDGSDLLGFYRTWYTIDNQTRWLAATHFEPTDARRAFPCFDEPRYRTPFTIYIYHSKNQTAVSNMPTEAILLPDTYKDIKNGFVWEKFQESPPMPTYLVAYMVSADFKSLTSPDEIVRVITRPNAIYKGVYALQQSIEILKYYEGYFGIPYALPKLDIVAVPGFSGGMENWGMTTYDEKSLILFDNDSATQKSNITTLLSHELSHLWFGDLVTPAWYDYLWIKEGFATYFEHFGTAAVEPSWNQDYIFVITMVQQSLWAEFNIHDSMTRRIRNFDEISLSFDEMSYDKAASVIRMFELMLSPSTFQNALHNYLKNGQQNESGVAVQKNLFDEFDKQVELDSVLHLPPHTSASDIMKTWSENIGYPVIDVIRNYDRGEAIITQRPLKSITGTTKTEQSPKWIVPLTYTTRSQMQFTNLQPVYWSFADEPTKLTGIHESDWVLFNLKQSGYYRVNYDLKNWILLTDQLLKNHTEIHVLNRAQLIDDAMALAYDGKLDYRLVINLLDYLQNETSVIPWYSASRSFNMLMDKYEQTKIEKLFITYFKELLQKAVKNIKCNISPTDDHIVKILKPTILSFLHKIGIEDCINELLETYQKYHYNLNKIQSELKPAVLCNALRYSKDPKSVYNHLWSHYKETTELSEKRQILKSIFSCTNDEEIIKSLLAKIMNPNNEEISRQDGLLAINNYIIEIPAVTASIKFMREIVLPKFPHIAEEEKTFFRNLINSIKYHLKTEEQLQLLTQIRDKAISLLEMNSGSST